MGAEMNEREALKLALEALDCICSPLYVREIEKIGSAMKVIREALAQPKQEPVAMRHDFDGYGWLYIDNGSGSNWKEKIKNAEPLYTTPPRREWVGLTDEEIKSEAKYFCNGWYSENPERLVLLVKTIQAKLEEKNGG